jgi:O-antigen/teichoic acid export membrane protein
MDPLIRAWVGPKFAESILVAQILIVVVTIRVGNATATTVLKGAGQHRLLAFTNAGTAVGNVALSLLWIRHYGLIGQAMGTLLPVAFSAAFILWPAACRRVNVSLFASFREAVWPTLWPIVAMALVVVPLRHALPARLWAVALAGAAGAVIYLITFVALAVTRSERQMYIGKINSLIAARRRKRVTAAAAA